MVFYRCQHQLIFGDGRCQDEPDWIINQPKTKTSPEQKEGCKLSPESCGKLIRVEEAFDLTAPWLNKPVADETESQKKKETEPKEKGKAKSKAAKKLEGEIAQKSMF